jgi:hypothetical protein
MHDIIDWNKLDYFLINNFIFIIQIIVEIDYENVVIIFYIKFRIARILISINDI